jgi:hypothetical protein
MKIEGAILAQVSDFKYLVNVISETEKSSELKQTCNRMNCAMRYLLANKPVQTGTLPA